MNNATEMRICAKPGRFGRPMTTCRLAILLVGLSPASAAAQPRSPFPFADPKQMFEQFFGPAPAEDQQALDEINIPAREESQIGDRASREYLAELRRRGIETVTRGEDIKYLESLVHRIRARMDNGDRYRTIRVHLAESSETDARSFPGGNLIFYRGMLDFAENEAALVGVIGHELSHLDHGHQLYDAKRMKLMQRTFSGADGFSPDQFFRNGALLMRSFSRPFRPEEESAADRDGATWAYELGYDPREMAKLFLRMHERDRGAKLEVPAFLRTHPFHLDRYEALMQRYELLQADRPRDDLYIGAENLRRRIPRTKKEF